MSFLSATSKKPRYLKNMTGTRARHETTMFFDELESDEFDAFPRPDPNVITIIGVELATQSLTWTTTGKAEYSTFEVTRANRGITDTFYTSEKFVYVGQLVSNTQYEFLIKGTTTFGEFVYTKQSHQILTPHTPPTSFSVNATNILTTSFDINHVYDLGVDCILVEGSITNVITDKFGNIYTPASTFASNTLYYINSSLQYTVRDLPDIYPLNTLEHEFRTDFIRPTVVINQSTSQVAKKSIKIEYAITWGDSDNDSSRLIKSGSVSLASLTTYTRPLLNTNTQYTTPICLSYNVNNQPQTDICDTFTATTLHEPPVISISEFIENTNSIEVFYTIDWENADLAGRTVNATNITTSLVESATTPSHVFQSLASNLFHNLSITANYSLNQVSQTSVVKLQDATTTHIPPSIAVTTVASSVGTNSVQVSLVTNWGSAIDDATRKITVLLDGNTTILSNNATSHLFTGLDANSAFVPVFDMFYTIRYNTDVLSIIDVNHPIQTIAHTPPTQSVISEYSKTETTIIMTVAMGSDGTYTPASPAHTLTCSSHNKITISYNPSTLQWTASGLVYTTEYRFISTKKYTNLADVVSLPIDIRPIIPILPAMITTVSPTLSNQTNGLPAMNISYSINTWGGYPTTPVFIQHTVASDTSFSLASVVNTQIGLLTTSTQIASLNANTSYIFRIKKSTNVYSNVPSSESTYNMPTAPTLTSVSRTFTQITPTFTAGLNNGHTENGFTILYNTLSTNLAYFDALQNTDYSVQIRKTTKITINGLVYTIYTLSNIFYNTRVFTRPTVLPTITYASKTLNSITFNVVLNSYADTTPEPVQIYHGLVLIDPARYTLNHYSSATQSVTIINLSSNTDYAFDFRKYFSINSGDLNDYIYTTSVLQTTPKVLYTPHTTLSIASVLNDNSQANITWTNGTDGDFGTITTRVFTQIGSATPVEKTSAYIPSTTRSFLLTGLGGSSSITYKIILRRSSTETQSVDVESDIPFTTNAITEPSMPSITSSTSNETSITVNWLGESNNSADNVTYDVVYQLGDQVYTLFNETSPTMISGLASNTLYAIRVKKLYYIDGLVAQQSKFSSVHDKRTAQIQVTLPEAPIINDDACRWVGNTFHIKYLSKPNGTATTVTIKGYYAIWNSSTSQWGSWIDLVTENGLSYNPETERTLEFTSPVFSAFGMYALQVGKEVNIVNGNVYDTVVVNKQSTDGGEDDNSFVPFGWWMAFPPPNNGNDPDRDRPEVPAGVVTSSYTFEGGVINNTGTISLLNDELPLSLVGGGGGDWYLTDPQTRKPYLNGGRQRQMLTAQLGAVNATVLLDYTINIVVHSKSDIWELKHNNLVISSTATNIRVTYAVAFWKDFPYTKSSNLFNDLTFVVSDDYNTIVFYENNILIQSQPLSALAGSLHTSGYIEMSSSPDTIVTEFTVLFGYCRTLADITANHLQKWGNGYDFHLVNTNSIVSVLDTSNVFTTTHTLEIEWSPSSWVALVQMMRQDEEEYTDITGSAGVYEKVYVDTAIGVENAYTSTLSEIAIPEMLKRYTTCITFTAYSGDYSQTDYRLNDPTNPHLINDDIHPTFKAEVHCSSINNFIIKYYLNTNANGNYNVIKQIVGYVNENYSTNIPFDITPVQPVYGKNILVGTSTMTNPNSRNYFEARNSVTLPNRWLQDGLVTSMLKNDDSNAINPKKVKLRILPHPVHYFSYDAVTKVYTVNITIDDLIGGETTATLLVDFTSGLTNISVTNLSGTLLFYQTGSTYADVQIPDTIAFPTPTETVLNLTFKKANRGELFASTPVLSRLSTISSTPRTNLYAYIEPWTDTKEYNFKVVFSNEIASGVEYLKATLILEKSRAQTRSYQIDISYTSGLFLGTTFQLNGEYINSSNTTTRFTFTRSGSAGLDATSTTTLGYINLYPTTPISQSDINFTMTSYTEDVTNFTNNTVFVKEGFAWTTPYVLSVVTDVVSSTHIRGLSTLTKDFQNLVSVVIDVAYDSSVVTFDSVTLSSFSLFYYSPSVTTPSSGTKRITITTSNPNNSSSPLSLLEFKWIPVETRRTHIDKNDITYTLVSASSGTNANPVTATVESVVAQNAFTLLCDMELKATVSTVLKSSTTEKSKMTFECSLDVFPDADITEFSINITYPIASVTNTTTLTTQQQNYTSVTSSTDTTGLLAIKTYTFSGIFEYESYVSTLEPITFHMSQKYLSSAFTQSDIVIELVSFTYYWDIHNLNLITPCLITENTDTYPAPYYRDITPFFFPTISLDGLTLKIAHDSLIPNPTTLNISTTAKVSVPNPTLELTSGTTSEITVTPSSLDAYGGDSLSYIDMTNFTASYSYSTGIRFGLQIIGTGDNYIPSHIKVIFFPQTIPQTGTGQVKIDVCVSKEHLPWTNIKYLKIGITQNSACLFTSFAPTQSARTTYTTGSSPEILYENNLSSNSLQQYSLSIPDVYYLGQAVFNLTDSTQPIEDWFPEFQLPSTLTQPAFEMTDPTQIYNFSLIQPTKPAYSPSITLKTQFYTYNQFYFQVKCSIDVGDNGLSGLHQLYVDYPTTFWESGLAILGRNFGANCSISGTQTSARLTINYEDTKTVKTSGLTEVVEFLLKYPGESYYDMYARNFVYFQTLSGFGAYEKIRTFDTAQFSLGVSANNMVVEFFALTNGRPNNGNGSVEKVVFQDVNGNNQTVEELTYVNRKYMNTGQADMTNSVLLERIENFSKRHLWYNIPFIAFDSDPYFLGSMVYSFLVPATVRRIAIKFRDNNEVIKFKYSSPISRFTEVYPYGTSDDGWTEEFLVMTPTPSPSNPDDPLYVDPDDPLFIPT